MRVGVGYSDNPDSAVAGVEAANWARLQAGREDGCDLVMLFSTARHNQAALLGSVRSVVGDSARVVGGGAVGIITNETFGYAGDQVGVALIWLDGTTCDIHMDGGLLSGEQAAGERMGLALKGSGVTPDSPVMFFYDAVDRTAGDVRLVMATWLLSGLEKGLGFLPDLNGAGLQGDHVCSPTGQFIGDGMGEHYAMALAFSNDLRIDSAIMHGCRPASPYYTVTKAEGPVILEINNTPAIEFIDGIIGPEITPDDYPFFLLFGVNHGGRWEEYDENNYASRLCLGLDKQRGGIVMFEPDMVAGTEFQLMYRSLDLNYMRPKIEKIFETLNYRQPVFAMYIDCAGRCAGYGGTDLEDALVVQEVVAGRVPLLGLYTGVEIASIGGRPRGLDWTGVFCLFSVDKGGKGASAGPRDRGPAWESRQKEDERGAIPVEAVTELCARNAAKVLELDQKSIAIRHELEQKRRGFSLLAELSVSLRQAKSYESLFAPVAQRINAALNMQKTAVLVPAGEGNGRFVPSVLQGYSIDEKARLAGRHIRVGGELLDPERPVLVTAADDEGYMSDLRGELMLPYLISAPVIIQNQVAAILITGRMVEQTPFLSRLGQGDIETVQAITALLASLLVHQRLDAAEERARIMLDAMPLCCIFWDEQGNQTDCNEEALRLFGVPTKEALLERLYQLAPERQPDGQPSESAIKALVLSAFVTGSGSFEWVFMTADGEIIPSEVTLVRAPLGENYTVAGYIRDLREQRAAIESISRARDLAEKNARAKSEFLATISHEIRTPVSAILAMTKAVSEASPGDSSVGPLIEQGKRSARLLTGAIDSLLDFSSIESGDLSIEERAFSVRGMTEGIADMLREEASGKSLFLRTEFSPDLPDTLMGDPTRIEQVIFNLVTNAVKFTDEGGVIVCARCEEEEGAARVRVVFEVEDTGIGISEEQLTQIFEPLTSADTSYSRRHSGLGMGLSLSRSLAQLMGGEIHCRSRLGEGSVFTFSLPLSLPEPDDGEIGEGVTPAPEIGELAGMRVLVAEDNPINQMIVGELLTVAGIEVVTVNNGREALAAMGEGKFDLVLMDIQMPEMDGLTAAAQMRSNSEYDDIPILAMTANSASEHREESRRSGMDGHLTKPIDVDEVYDALRKWGKGRAR